MKQTIAILVFLVGSVSSAAPALQSLGCVLTNGVLLTTTDVELDGLTVKSEWGVITKDFKAVLAEQAVAGQSVIQLLNSKGEADYFIYLPINKRMLKQQTVEGTVGAPDLFVKGHIRFVAGVSCDVDLARR